MDPFDLSFVEWSLVCDDPKLLEQVQSRYYDPDFDDWLEEFDKEQQNATPVELPDKETIEWSTHKPHSALPTEEYEMGDASQFKNEDWEHEE